MKGQKRREAKRREGNISEEKKGETIRGIEERKEQKDRREYRRAERWSVCERCSQWLQ